MPLGQDDHGAALLLRIEEPWPSWQDVALAVSWLRCRQPAQPLVLLVPDTPALELCLRTQLALALGVRAVLPSRARRLDGALRAALTHPATLASDLLAWLRLRNLPVDARTARILESILERASDHTKCSELLDVVGISERSARAHLKKKRLPPPGHWLRFARALRAALLLQRHPEIPLWRLALENGYADHSALSQQMRRTFAVAVSQIRATVGWEWLSLRWLQRQGVLEKRALVTETVAFRRLPTLCSRCRAHILAYGDAPVEGAG